MATDEARRTEAPQARTCNEERMAGLILVNAPYVWLLMFSSEIHRIFFYFKQGCSFGVQLGRKGCIENTERPGG